MVPDPLHQLHGQEHDQGSGHDTCQNVLRCMHAQINTAERHEQDEEAQHDAQCPGNVPANRIRYKRRRNRAVSVYDQTESVRGLDIRKHRRHNENFYPEMDADTDAED